MKTSLLITAQHAQKGRVVMRRRHIQPTKPLTRRELVEMFLMEMHSGRLSRANRVNEAIRQFDVVSASAAAKKSLLGIAAMVMLAIVTIGSSPAKADGIVQESLRTNLVAIVRDEQEKTCRTGSTRAIMYVGQVVDAFATASAVRHGATQATPYGLQSSPMTYIVSQAAFDIVMGALERKRPCWIKNGSNVIVGVSAFQNALMDGAK